MSASDTESDQIQIPQCRDCNILEHKRAISQEKGSVLFPDLEMKA